MRPTGVLYVDVYPMQQAADGSIAFVLFKRRADVVMPNVWQGISGKIEPEEKIRAAFCRQIVKKTGHVPLRLFKLDYVNTYYDDHYDTVMLVPSAGCVIGEAITLDARLHSEHRVVSDAELPSLVHFPNQLHAFRLAAEHLRAFARGHPTHELTIS